MIADFEWLQAQPVRWTNRKQAMAFNGKIAAVDIPFVICFALYQQGHGTKAIAKRLGLARGTAVTIGRQLKSVQLFDPHRPSPFHTGAMKPKPHGGNRLLTYQNATLADLRVFGILERRHARWWSWDTDRAPCGDSRAKIRAANKRMLSTPHLRIKFYLRKRLRNLLKGQTSPCRTADLTGCTFHKLKRHLEAQFRDGMTWANHGRNGWHIDHIIACSRFNLTDIAEAQRCFHYTNLRPMWASENISKGDSEVHRTLTLPTVISGQGQFVCMEDYL